MVTIDLGGIATADVCRCRFKHEKYLSLERARPGILFLSETVDVPRFRGGTIHVRF